MFCQTTIALVATSYGNEPYFLHGASGHQHLRVGTAGFASAEMLRTVKACQGSRDFETAGAPRRRKCPEGEGAQTAGATRPQRRKRSDREGTQTAEAS